MVEYAVDPGWTVHHLSHTILVSLTVEESGCSMSQLKSPIMIVDFCSCIPHSIISCKFSIHSTLASGYMLQVSICLFDLDA